MKKNINFVSNANSSKGDGEKPQTSKSSKSKAEGSVRKRPAKAEDIAEQPVLKKPARDGKGPKPLDGIDLSKFSDQEVCNMLFDDSSASDGKHR